MPDVSLGSASPVEGHERALEVGFHLFVAVQVFARAARFARRPGAGLPSITLRLGDTRPSPLARLLPMKERAGLIFGYFSTPLILHAGGPFDCGPDLPCQTSRATDRRPRCARRTIELRTRNQIGRPASCPCALGGGIGQHCASGGLAHADTRSARPMARSASVCVNFALRMTS